MTKFSERSLALKPNIGLNLDSVSYCESSVLNHNFLNCKIVIIIALFSRLETTCLEDLIYSNCAIHSCHNN